MSAQHEAAKNEQVSSVVQNESMQAYNAQVSAAYERALSDYNTELSQVRELEDEVLQIEARMEGEEDEIRKSNLVLAEQFDSEKSAVLTQLDREIRECNEEISKNSICSTLEGTITELSIVEGQVIAAGDYVARVSSGDQEDNVVVCYVPVADGRKIKKGMSASVYPSTANKQEYGHMRGTVAYVDEYVTSRAEITNQVGVVSLVDSFLQNGPVVEVRLELERDDSTESGYWWSSKKGNEIELVKGTMVAADISIEEKQPISMLVPYLKEKLTIKQAEENTDNG
ncbi:MAG: NHLP bacteriocin system secretion protein [Lachnospiraceae bacterium]|nr:NHLP bacteriocin system secretion protein [Lachnospiraceae bacterium]